jgi:putative ABC transport system substrate-binding protein
MKRKIINLALCAVLFALCSSVESQQPKKIAKIAYLAPSTPAAAAHLVEAFRQGLRELGYVEGKTVVLELRYGEARAERLSELARELAGLKMDVIVTSTDVAIAAVKRETQTIPIVMANSSDPVGTGFVVSLAHPGGNITGLSSISPELSGKRLS